MDENFRSIKRSKTASITLNGNVESVFPLFGAFEERKWAGGWDPRLIYPEEETIEEGTSFKTSGHAHDEKELLWIVSKYDQMNYLIQYLVVSESRYWFITIQCQPMPENKTMATITYAFIGLNEMGDRRNQHALDQMYKNDLQDWEGEINAYMGGAAVE